MREHTDRWLNFEAKGETCIVVHLAEYSCIYSLHQNTNLLFFFVICESFKQNNIVWTVFDFTSSHMFSYIGVKVSGNQLDA